MKEENIVIGIEGMVGSGKTSICRKLLDYIPNSIILHGGNIYRAVVYGMMNAGIDLKNIKNKSKNLDVLNVMQKLGIDIKLENRETVIYINNKNVRLWIDKNIFRKEVIQNNLPTIELNESDTQNIYAFNKYIGVLSKNQFAIYDNSGKKQDELNIEITKPIFNSSGRHLVIAEEKGQKVYLITDKGIAWEKSIEGNGYVAITILVNFYLKLTRMVMLQ